jgi:hypothetical protein
MIGWVGNDLRTVNDSNVLYGVPYVIDINFPVTDTFLCSVYSPNLVIGPMCAFRSHRAKGIWDL